MKICITGDSILMAPFPENYPGFEAVKAQQPVRLIQAVLPQKRRLHVL